MSDFEIKHFSSALLDLTQFFQLWKAVSDELGKIWKEKHIDDFRYAVILLFYWETVKNEQNIPLRKLGVREGSYKALDNI